MCPFPYLLGDFQVSVFQIFHYDNHDNNNNKGNDNNKGNNNKKGNNNNSIIKKGKNDKWYLVEDIVYK